MAIVVHGWKPYTPIEAAFAKAKLRYNNDELTYILIPAVSIHKERISRDTRAWQDWAARMRERVRMSKIRCIEA